VLRRRDSAVLGGQTQSFVPHPSGNTLTLDSRSHVDVSDLLRRPQHMSGVPTILLSSNDAVTLVAHLRRVILKLHAIQMILSGHQDLSNQ
jgi:hypothetical protein